MQERRTERRAKEAVRDFERNARAAANQIEASRANGLHNVREFQLNLLAATQENVNALFEFAHDALQATSVSELVEVSTSHSRRQVQMMAEHAQQVAQTAQRMAINTAPSVQG